MDKQISIPEELFKRIESKIEGTEFGSVSAYIVYVIQQVLGENSLDKEQQENVKERLKDLGYL